MVKWKSCLGSNEVVRVRLLVGVLVKVEKERNHARNRIEAAFHGHGSRCGCDGRWRPLRRRRKNTGRSEVYVRQGEWFFVPCPEFDSDRHIVAHNGTLVRYQAKRHHVEMLCRPPDGETYVRGKVWHPDHRTIYLDGWHKVRRNTEVVPSDFVVEREAEQRDALFQVNFVD